MTLQPILFVPDVHRPFHDKRAYSLMVKVARDLKPHTIAVIGDYADFFAISSHSKDPARAVKFQAEVKDSRLGLKELETLGAKRMIFCEGNHEDRWRRFISDRAPELSGITSVPELLGLQKWEFVPYRQSTNIGKLVVTHDVGHVGRYSGFKSLDTVQGNVVTGHSHRLSYMVEGNAKGEAHVSAQFGWLGDAKAADYMVRIKALRDWALGFGIGYLQPNTGAVHLIPVPVVNYGVVFNGKLYR